MEKFSTGLLISGLLHTCGVCVLCTHGPLVTPATPLSVGKAGNPSALVLEVSLVQENSVSTAVEKPATALIDPQPAQVMPAEEDRAELSANTPPKEHTAAVVLKEKKPAAKPERALPAKQAEQNSKIARPDIPQQQVKPQPKKAEALPANGSASGVIGAQGLGSPNGANATDDNASSSTSALAGQTKAAPNYRVNPKPEYPISARRMRHEGVVLLEVQVTADGLAKAVTLKKSSNYEELDQAAIRAVKQWRFNPAKINTVVVASTVQVPVRFELK